MKTLLAVALLALPVLAQPPSDRVEKLVGQMTLTEKLGQLQMLDGDWSGSFRPEHPGLIREGKLGSTLNVRGARRVNELQRAAQESRLKIPMLFGFDVIHGHRTQFPIPLGEAATFSPSDAEESARIAAREASSTGLKWTFAPMVDIARDARWGRVAESSGEDVFLGCAMAQARVRGFQGPDPAQADRLLACSKHWAAYGAAEAGRDYNTTDVSERTLREVYFPPFLSTVQSGVGSFMAGFNELNGVPVSGSSWLLTDVLRTEWGFPGLVVSDYNSITELVAHGYAKDDADAARLGITAGVDIEMVSRAYNTHLPRLVAEGKVPIEVIDRAVRRVLRVKDRLGLFDNPFVNETLEASTLGAPAHREAARRIAGRSLVLLKNNGVLPLKAPKVALLGPLADDPVSTIGCWSADARPTETVTLLQALREALPGKVTYAKAVDLNVKGSTGNYDDRPVTATNAGGTNVANAEGVAKQRLAQTPVGPQALAEALKAAREADVVVLAVGETAAMSGEASSRTDLGLPGRQLELIQAVAKLGKPYVVVLFNGRPLTIGWLAEHSPAILEAWAPGTEGGHAIADVLLGKVNPGGKLPVSFPRRVGQEPLYYSHKKTGKAARKDKYTSKYLDELTTALYPFGYGLSYTKFALRDFQAQVAGTGIEASVEVANTGPRAGDEVVQLYVQDAAASFTRPVKELRGFERVTLQPGESKRVAFKLGPSDLGMFDQNMHWRVEPGQFKLWAATSSEGGLETTVELP